MNAPATTAFAAAEQDQQDPASFALSPRAFRTTSSLGHYPNHLHGAGSIESALSSPPQTPLGGGGFAPDGTHNPAPLAPPSSSDLGAGGGAYGDEDNPDHTYQPNALPYESRVPERADADALARHCAPARLAAMLAAMALLPPPAPIPEAALRAGSACSPRAASAVAHEAARAANLERKASEGLEAFEAAERAREREAAAITPQNAERRDACETSATAARVHALLKSGGEEGLTPATLRRWLIARKGDGARAAKDLAAHGAWRAALVPLGRILEDDDLAPELAQNKVVLAAIPEDYDDEEEEKERQLSSQQQQQLQQRQPRNPAYHALTSLTARGHPIVLLYAQRHVSHHSRDPGSSSRVRRLIMYAIDAAVAAAVPSPCNPCRKIVAVFDLSGFSRRNFDVGGLKAIFEALNHHYPERCVNWLGAFPSWWSPASALTPHRPPPQKKPTTKQNSLSSLILLRAPPAFAALWMLVKPFIDPVTAAKVRFVGSLPAMRRLMARLMAGEGAARAAELCERRRAELAKRQRQRQGRRDKKARQHQGEGQAENEEEETLPPELQAAAREVARALRRLPAAIVGVGFGMPDERVPTIDSVTARLVTAGRMPRATGDAETVPLPRAEEPEDEEEEEAAAVEAAGEGKGGAKPGEAAAASPSSWSARLKLPKLMKRMKEFSLYSVSS